MPAPPDIAVVREIADGAKVSPLARIGAFCVVGPRAVIGPGTVLGRRVTIAGATTLGRDNVVADGCALGTAPQDLKYRGRPTFLIVGDRNRFGANVTVHLGTEEGGYLTRIGNDNVLEAGVHVAHDCYLDDRTHLGTDVLLAGHVRVQTGAVVEELTGAHQFTTLGRYSRVGSRTPVRRDVPPFTCFASRHFMDNPAVEGVNERGLEAACLAPGERDALRQAVRHLFQDDQALVVKVDLMLRQEDLPEPVRHLCQFCLQSLAGRVGRHREAFRGKLPPEAQAYLLPEFLAQFRAGPPLAGGGRK